MIQIRDMTRMALCVALMAVCAWMTIPSPVPFTMQSFAVFFALGLLGGRRGSLCILAYILLGAVGVPVFSGFRGGVGVLLGSSGGFLIGFLAAGLVYSLLTRLRGESMKTMAAGMTLGMAAAYGLGSAWFYLVYLRSGQAATLGAVLSWCVWPFVLPDAVKIYLALLLCRRLRKRLGA